MRHEVRVAVTMNMAAFWHMILCSLVENCQCFERAVPPSPDCGSTSFLWTIKNFQPYCMASQPTRLQYLKIIILKNNGHTQ
jgi:hypothetical protein